MNKEHGADLWFATDYKTLDELYAAISRLIPDLSNDIRRQVAISRQNAEDDAKIGIAETEDTRTTAVTAAIRIQNIRGQWVMAVPDGIQVRRLTRRKGQTTAQSERPDVELAFMWSIDTENLADQPVTLAERIDRLIERLIDRAANDSMIGGHPVETWVRSDIGQNRIARTRSVLEAILTRPAGRQADRLTCRIGKGPHLTIRPVAERIEIRPVQHEPRKDTQRDWGGARRILAETADKQQRLFITEGHTRRVGKRNPTGYTPASLWIQGDRLETLFGKNSVIYQGLVTQSVLKDLGPRIDAGFQCVGLSDFLSIHQTIVIKPK